MTDHRQPAARRAPATAKAMNVGKIVQVIGAVDRRRVRAGAPAGDLQRAARRPRRAGDGHIDLTLEVQQHIGRNQVRARRHVDAPTAWCAAWRWSTPAARSRCRSATPPSAASSTCSASRWTAARPIPARRRALADPPRARPLFVDLEPKTEVFETGIKVDRPDRAVREGRQDRPVRRRRRGQDGHHPGAHQQRRRRATAASRCSAAWASARARATTSTSR